MHNRPPPRIYITSVDETSTPSPTQLPPSVIPEALRPRRLTTHPLPIPSIDLSMSLDKQHHQYINSQYDPEETQQINAPLPNMRNSMEPQRRDELSEKSSLAQNWPIVSQQVALLAIFFLLWGVAFSVLPRQLTEPNTPFMRLWFLFVGAQTSGILVSLTGLPDMLGMLFWGVVYTNVGWADFEGLQRLEVFLREMALINIMLLAGLGLDYESLKKLFRFIMQLTLIPTVAEVVAIAGLSRYLLDLPWLWGILLGLVVTAVSPNVVVTVLLRLKEERLGMNKGIHTLIIAMTSCNDVLAIFLFGVILGVIFSTGNLTSQILQGPIGIVIGLVFGGACGVGLLYMPSYQAKYTNGLRFSMTILAGTLSVVGSKLIGYPSAGALGCIVTSFVAGTGWKKRIDYDTNEVGMYLDLLWKFLKPVSFSLIGKEVNFAVLEGSTVLYGSITLAVAVVLRLVFSYLATLGSDLNWKEKSYVTLSGFPKATVQAALGPAAMDLARSLNAVGEYARAQTVLIVTVLAIIFTAPLGALLMVKLAPKWLKRGPAENEHA
ncbi:sodium/hydrogen exchanger 9B2-like [Toxorhynchites rutilus septentrionalis]|uniref:sodium/hydrogen exchanger 9B2-like n=1 Tax=Toxorhynchites rutilus septentrionalis TaxID=329112 RepID=UPI002479E0A4|nr:sodium/hydrogen exchanger 9B2-like [Toxorhynchites rutilus septentrionalis]